RLALNTSSFMIGSSLFEHDLRAIAFRVCREGKPVSTLGSSPRACFSGSCFLRMFGMVYHVFADVALAAVGARGGIVALNVAVLAAGDIFGRAGCDIVGAAEGIVILAERIGHRRLPPLEAAGKQGCCEQECEELGRCLRWHDGSKLQPF